MTDQTNPEWITSLPKEKDFDYWSGRFKARRIQFNETKAVSDNHIELNLPEKSLVAFIGDQHVGSPESDYERIEKEVSKIVNTDNAYIIIMGDTVDGYFWGGEAQYGEMEQTPEQYQYIKSMMDYLGDNKKLLCAIGGDHDCLDEKTEVYTQEDGWITYDHLNQNHHLLTTGDQQLEWSQYDNKIVEDYSGEMYQYSSTHHDILCTPKHRIFYKQRRSQKVKFMSAQQAFEKKSLDDMLIPVSGSFKNEGVNISDDVLYLLGFLIGDGHVSDRGYITFYQSKQNKLNKLLKALDEEKIGYKLSKRNRVRDFIDGLKVRKILPAYEVSLPVSESKKLNQYIDIQDKKQLKPFFNQLSDAQFELFLKGLIDADGSVSKTSKNCCCFYQKDKLLIDKIQALCIQHNYSASIYEYQNRARVNQYRLNITKRNNLRLGGHLTKTVYTGKIWDVSIPPNRNFLVRRKGKSYFTGNSWSHRGGTNPLREFTQQNNCFYSRGVTYITINIGGQAYKITAAHRLPGHSMYNKNHPQTRALRFGGASGSDIVVAGHTHQKGISEFGVDSFGGNQQKVHLLSLGAYKRCDDYGRKLGLNALTPDSMYGSAVILDKEQKHITTYYDVLDGLKAIK